MIEKGALRYDQATATYSVDFASFDKWVRELVQDICILQATGDYAGTKKLFEQYVMLGPELSASLERLTDIPVDIRPHYSVAEKLLTGTN